MLSPDLLNPNTQNFRFCPACGQKGLGPASVKSFACPDCGFLFFINCAAAAMGLILDPMDRLLVTCRKFDPGKGSPDLPGGFAEPGEGIEAALVREIKEELNLEVGHLTYFASCFNAYPYGGVTYPVTDMGFICRVKTLDTLIPGDDVADISFIPVPELDPASFAMASARQMVAWFKERFSGSGP